MKKFIDDIKSDRITYGGFLISFLLIIISVVYIGFYYKNLPPFVPLFNQLPWGDQRIVPTLEIFIPIILLFIIFIFNLVFTSVTYQKSPLIGRLVAATTLLISIMNFIFILRTVFIVI